MKNLLLFLLLIANISANAQKNEQIKGRWIYKDLINKEKLDSMTLKHANLVFSNVTIEFLDEGNCFYNSLKGTWSLNQDENKILISIENPLNPDEKKKSEWGIIELTTNLLKLNLGKTSVIMQKQALASAEKSEDKQENIYETKSALKIPIANLAEKMKKQDLFAIQNVTILSGVSSFSKFRGTAKRYDSFTYQVDSSFNYKSKEPIFNDIAPFYFHINQFDDGVIQVWYSIQAEEVSLATQEIIKAGFKFIGKDGVFDFYLKDAVGITIPPIGSPSGGTCSLFLYNQKK